MGRMNYDFLSMKQKIKARIVETSDITIEEFLNRICVFNNPQVTDTLLIVVGNENIFLGYIKTITQTLENEEEVWYIETNMGSYKFKILNKSPNNITNNKEIIEHLSKLLHKASDDIIDNFVADIFIKEDFNYSNIDRESINSQKFRFPWEINDNQDNGKLDLEEIPSFLKRNK